LNKKISAIIWDEYQPLAIINDELVPEGYTFQIEYKFFALNKNELYSNWMIQFFL
jgi:hypothetical protein